ncbi:transposase [Gluconacetobacter entanii]|nr:transposase [Gluconacetobacter entanii]
MEPVPHWFKGCLRITFWGPLWIARNGSPWRDLPIYFGYWNSVCSRCRDWTKAGVVQKLFKAVPDDAGMEYAMVRRAMVRVHRHGQDAKGGPKNR